METIKEEINKNGFFIIAEIGVNYYDIAKKKYISNIDAAKLMCLEAKKAGASAVKFQSYKADTIASKYSPSYWDTTEESTTSQYELFKKFDSFGYEEYKILADYCNEIGIIFMSTPFDFESADYLDEIMDYYKISSSDITNIPFIEYICKKNKPIILSVGASNENEIEHAVETILKNGNPLILLHCVLEYPTTENNAHIGRITAIKNKYPDLLVGYSDHAKPNFNYAVLQAAYSLGATVIEKHFTLDKSLPGNDHYHAMDPEDLINIRRNLSLLRNIIGEITLSCNETESIARMNARRSIVLTRSKKIGDIIEKEDITFKRPGIGITPEDYIKVIGKKVLNDLPEDTILEWKYIEK